MSVTVDVAVAGVRLGMPRALAVSAVRSVLRAEHVHRATLSVAFVDDRRIAALNHTHLGHRGVTDVISFPFQPATSDAALTGDIYIAP
ncbi:MAG: rRNA maturation RNAse YbeY, partial [Gemmatimonadaceae bacterium]